MTIKKGFVLITVLAMVIVIGLSAAMLLQSTGGLANAKSNTVAEVQARYLAEAGMWYALWQCRNSGGTCSGSSYVIDGTTVTISATALTGGTYNITTSVDYTDL